MINSAKFPRAYSEVYSFLNALGNNYIKQIPSSVYNTIKENRDVNYNPVFNSNQKITNDMLSQEAISLIAALNLQYWCKDAEEKKELKQTYINNKKLEEEKYSYDNLFKNNKNEAISDTTSKEITNNETSESQALVEYKENLFMKIINKIKGIFSIFKK